MSNHHSKLEELLDALEGLPASARGEYLEHNCTDPDLRREALALLAAETDSRGFLGRLADGIVPRLEESPDLTGRRIGAYELVKPLGQGGMGVVYEARRVDGAFEQHVAVKLLTTALAGTGARKQFLVERQILAGLEHPAIARIIDGGVTEDGTPWFAMECVEGLPIDAYCDRHRLGIRERLELFLQVCDAVEHAHRRLVVHRDLKPANVLVTQCSPGSPGLDPAAPGMVPSHDSRVRPSALPGLQNPRAEDSQIKMLDFGIAKLLDSDAAVPETRTAMRLMTPEYASPEQVRGEAVTTASDVYQLGLLLYELLSGHRPYALRRRTTGELERVICEQPPTRLSTALTREDTIVLSPAGAVNLVDELCRIRRTTRTRLRRRLRGDLDNIAGKALSKEPERRYGSADRLAQDIRRHLGDLPVSARPDTMVYRTRKFLQRHAMGAAAATAMIALIGGLTGLYLVQLQQAYERAETERVQAQVERDRAETEAVKARQVSDFLADIFQSANPQQSGAAKLTARELVDRGVRRLDAELAGQPEIQAEMLHVLGRTYLGLNEFDSAEEVLTRAHQLQLQRLSPDHPEIARALSDLGWLRYMQGRYPEARQLLEQALGILESSPGDDGARLAGVLRYLGATYRALGEHESGLDVLERALAIQERVSAPDSRPLSRILNSIGIQLKQMSDYVRAEEMFNRSLEISRQVHGQDSATVGLVLLNLANLKVDQGMPAEAETLYRRAVEILEQAYGVDNLAVAIAYFNFGVLMNESGRAGQAVELLEKSLKIVTASAPDHPNISQVLGNLGVAHFASGRFDEARDYFLQQLAMQKESSGNAPAGHSATTILSWLGRTEIALGNADAARGYLDDALERLQEVPEAPADPAFQAPLNYLSHWLAGQQRCGEAAQLYDQSRNIQAPGYPAFGIPVEDVETALARCRNETPADAPP